MFNLVGQLMGISLKADFSLEMSEPKEGFKQIRNAKSFRACLQQVKTAAKMRKMYLNERSVNLNF